MHRESAPEKRTLELLSQRLEGARLEGGALVLEDDGLRVRAALPYREGPCFQLEVTAEHPDFFEPLTASAAGYAETDEALAQAAAEELAHTLFSALPPALRGRGRVLPELVLWGREHRFRASASEVVLLGGGGLPGGQDLWSRIGEEILPYLGNKNVYWLRLYIARMGEEASCEARLNGWVVPELTSLLSEAARSWLPEEGEAWSAKQYVVFVQEQETRVRCPYTWEDAWLLTGAAIRFFEQGVKYEALPRALGALTDVPSLAEDVLSLLPEHMTRMFLPQVKISSTVLLQRDGREAAVRFTQMRAWDPVYQAAVRHLRRDRPDKAKLLRIVGGSAISRAVGRALEAGTRPEELLLSQAFMISESYQLW